MRLYVSLLLPRMRAPIAGAGSSHLSSHGNREHTPNLWHSMRLWLARLHSDTPTRPHAPRPPAHPARSGVTEGFNIEPTLGALVSIKAALNADSLRPDVKYVLRAGQLVPAARGAPMHALTSRGGGVAEADQERMWALCNEWMHVWRAHAALNDASQAPRVAAAPSGGAAPLASTAAASGDAASTGKSSSAASRRRKASIAA